MISKMNVNDDELLFMISSTYLIAIFEKSNMISLYGDIVIVLKLPTTFNPSPSVSPPLV